MRRKGQRPFQTMRVRTVHGTEQMIRDAPRPVQPVGPQLAPVPHRVEEPFISIVVRRGLFHGSTGFPLETMQPAIRVQTKELPGYETVLLRLIHPNG